ncbi:MULTISPECIES: ABC transporter ATP-binding protein [Bradyrhizobium]|jgi:branched-chain amino acid transport system ATP-binding protein|uniref:ABC transporter ATP-binding protein n=1 Tax=Bradyrhizobium TaxID=374 RepID=UPI00047F2067|nr:MULTISPECIES: ABC transporter ATP-binding protein [Bradyrhizobium]MCS3451208.1 branched-chain amino acid transport system ATP-binding protein [Bradyrhizobium elkanii]MCS3566769.1 branched-chain amino acid transport system ATP-binding protein [Bradyrhizobium elkanii]MCW2152507.1 branched-chain amino acid transport system ATP-binding protein [Bradyrhizobium elkanii]MCW2357616.1 branched-chain amino acid transport system ATP-binding protein [Bradyrhizobium elkanii]MCW2376237.1 branched-chain a
MLEIEGLSSGYGGPAVLNDVSLRVGAGEIVTVVGANGAGKTTLLNTVAGLLRPMGGKVLLDGVAIGGRSAERIVRVGLSLVPEGRQVVAPLSVEENLLVGAFGRTRGGAADTLAAIYQRFPRLKERRRQPAGLLSGGEQQMLAIGRALMAGPRVLLLDEPSMGLAPLVVSEIFTLLGELNQQGIAVLLVEQNARKALALAERGYVLEGGRIVLHGPAGELMKSPAIVDAYLGASVAAESAA